MKRKHHQFACDKVGIDQLSVNLKSSDEAIRASAVRALCPCHAGWLPFEQHLKTVAELQKDESPLVRGAALHVFEDAAEMDSSGYPTNPREVSNEMLRTKRASRFPSVAEEIAERARSKRRESRVQKKGSLT